MRASTIGMLMLGFVIGIVGCARPTTPGQPSAEGETPAATEEHKVLKPVIEEPAAEAAEPAAETAEPAAEPAAETTEPATDEAKPETEAKEPPTETAEPESEPAKQTPATDDES